MPVVLLRIPRILAADAGGRDEVPLEARTVSELLEALRHEFPLVFRSVCNERGEVRQHINLFVNDDLIGRRQLDIELSADDVVSVYQAVSGG